MPARTIADLLESSGVLPEIRSGEAWAEAVRGGLSVEALDAVMAAFGFTAAELERCVIAIGWEGGSRPRPPTPPDVRVRIRRFFSVL